MIHSTPKDTEWHRKPLNFMFFVFFLFGGFWRCFGDFGAFGVAFLYSLPAHKRGVGVEHAELAEKG